MMTRRELIRLAGSSALFAGLGPGVANTFNLPIRSTGASDRLFFGADEVGRIRANAATPMLRGLYEEWAAIPVDDLARAFDTYDESGNMTRDFQAGMYGLGKSTMVQLIDPSAARERAILEAIERVIAYPYWDYFRDGGEEVIGIQRASFAAVRMLLAREVLGDAIGDDLDARMLDAIADKGCLPCYATIFDMENPDTVKGWDFDEHHADFYSITMERWPMILGANNLRAAPTGALGLGALALRGHDPRAQEWLGMAVASTDRFLKLVSEDGSYFEGLSYLSYSLRTILPFVDAHLRLVGDVDWVSKINLDGMLEYIVTMQMGKRPDGSPDIVNFSDAWGSVPVGSISRIGDYTGNPLAGFAAEQAGITQFYYDFLWYRPDAPSAPPAPSLLNKHNDLNWVICRSGWEPDDTVIAFKSGGPANHEHADRNHITLKAHGERLLHDQVGAAYDRRHAGWKLRFTEAHNAVLVDGRGHPYIDGLEGTNDSKAYATILQYEDRGYYVWWTSDATAAYILDNYHAHQVLRTVLFAKPDVVVVLDQVRLRYRPQTVDVRFYPDNRDGAAGLKADGNRFVLSRPRGRLDGFVFADTDAAPRVTKLDIPAEVGDFPCVEVHSSEALEHHIMTVLVVSPGAEGPVPDVAVNRDGNEWHVTARGLDATIDVTAHEPVVRV